MQNNSLSSGGTLSFDHVSFSFGPTKAVRDVCINFDKGKTHALLGENGAGKSTMVKLMSGLLQPDTGTIRYNKKELNLTSPKKAHKSGIRTAFQELSLIDELSVLDNFSLPYAGMNFFGLIKRKQIKEKIETCFSKLKLEIPIEKKVENFDLAIKQKIEIARALYCSPSILLLDEPTSSLSVKDVEWLREIVIQREKNGLSTVFISHRMKEVRAFCSVIHVMRNGKHVYTGEVAEISDDEVIQKIIGDKVKKVYTVKKKTSENFGPSALKTEKLCVSDQLFDCDLELRQGEVLGVAALQGMGQLELFHACFGAETITKGKLLIDSKPVNFTSPKDAVQPEIAIGFVPEDRKTEGLFLSLSGSFNTSVTDTGNSGRRSFFGDSQKTKKAGNCFMSLEIDETALWKDAGDFSGGNQQKIVLAKWLYLRARILLLYDPTRGIDIGTKKQIYHLIGDYASKGGAVLFYSTEIPELVSICDRVIVLYQGRKIKELSESEINEDQITKYTMGQFEQ